MKRRETDGFRHRWAPMGAYLLIAGVLAYGLYLQRQTTHSVAVQARCEVLDHRIGSQTAARAFLTATKTNGETLNELVRVSIAQRVVAAREAGDLSELARQKELARTLERADDRLRRILIPPSPSDEALWERDQACLRADIGTGGLSEGG